MFHNTVVKVFTAKVSVTSGCEDFEHAVVNGEKGHIEGTTAQIVDDNLTFAALLVKSVGDSGSCRFVDDSQNVETGDGASILGCLTLSVVEVGRDTLDMLGSAHGC